VGWKTYLNPKCMSMCVARKTITKGYASQKNAAPVCSGQISTQGRQFDLGSNPLEVTSKSFLRK